MRYPRLFATLRALGVSAVLGLGPAVPSFADEPKAPVVPPREGKSETLVLFNGKDLDGWQGHTGHWSVVDGEIVGQNDQPVPVSTYLLTKRTFSDVRITATAKLARSEMHSGIAFWGR